MTICGICWGELRVVISTKAMRVSVVKVLSENEEDRRRSPQLFGRKPEYVAPGGA